MNTSDRPPSDGWGNDPLTQYLDACRNNQWATFDSKHSEVTDLIAINGMFRKLLCGAINPQPALPINFLVRAHSAYLSACGAVMAGQVHDAQALLRVCLEQGGYALYIGDDDERWELWTSRHDSDDAMKAVRKEFTHGNVMRCIMAADSDLGCVYSTLYNQTIDYGAHPNELGMFASMTMKETDDGSLGLNAIYLQGNGLLLDFALKSTAQIGICVLKISNLIYPIRVKITGVGFLLKNISKRF